MYDSIIIEVIESHIITSFVVGFVIMRLLNKGKENITTKY